MTDREGLEKLAPCPFCGSPARKGSENEVIVDGHDVPDKCIVDQILFICTPDSWNRRALLAEDREEGEPMWECTHCHEKTDWALCRECSDEKARNTAQVRVAEAASADTDGPGLREALERIIGLCGDVDRCACGRPTGIPAIVSCARQALSVEVRRPGLESAAWDMLHAVEAADAQGELAENIGGELIDALRAALTSVVPPRPAPAAGTAGPGLRELLERALDWIHREHDDCDDGCDARALAAEIESALAARPVEAPAEAGDESELRRKVTAVIEEVNGGVWTSAATVAELLQDILERTGELIAARPVEPADCLCAEWVGKANPECPVHGTHSVEGEKK